MAVDLTLASLHHLAVFTLAAILAAEIALASGEVDARALARLARVDRWYGVVAALVVIVGVARVMFGAKGSAYYIVNHLFWTKMALFALVGLLSAAPTLRIIAWRRQARAEPAFRPDAPGLARVRALMWTQAALFAAIPVAAAAMARGYGV